jgi:hypothetical protein
MCGTLHQRSYGFTLWAIQGRRAPQIGLVFARDRKSLQGRVLRVLHMTLYSKF